MLSKYRIANLDDPCTCGFTVDGDCANLRVFWNTTTLQPQPDNERQYLAHMVVTPTNPATAL